MRSPYLTFALISAISALLLGGCAISDEPAIGSGGAEGGFGDAQMGDADGGVDGGDGGGDGGGGAGGNDGDGGEPPADEPGPVTQACGDATGEPTFRFTTIAITEPASLGGLLGALMNSDIEKGILNILVELRGLTPDGDAFDVLGGGGAVCDGSEGAYTWDTTTPDAQPSQPFPATLDGDGKFAVGDDSSVLYFPITLLGASVRLDRLRVAGTLAEGHDSISAGELSGYILRSTAEAIEFPESLGIPGTLATAMPVNAVEDCDGEECWALAATYEAALVTQHAAP